MLQQLIWTDVRLSRSLLVVIGLTLLAAIGVAVAMVQLLSLESDGRFFQQVSIVLVTSARFFEMLSLGTITILAGNIVASERSVGRFSFLAYLPLSRTIILGSKLLVILLTALIVAWLCLCFQLVASVLSADPDVTIVFVQRLPPSRDLIPFGIVMVSAAFSGSVFIGSPAISTILGLSAPSLLRIAVLLPLTYVVDFSPVNMPRFEQSVYLACSVLLLLLSWRHFVKRETLSGL